MKKIIFTFMCILPFNILWAGALRHEAIDVLFSVDSAPLQKINMSISFNAHNMNNISIDNDGVTIKTDGYECYNAIINSIRNNSTDGMKKYIYENNQDKEKQVSGILRFLNNYWNNVTQNATPKLVKIVYFGNKKAFFIQFHHANTKKSFVLYIPIQRIAGNDYFVDNPDAMNPPFLSLITYTLMNGGDFNAKTDTFKCKYSLVDGENGVFLHFNGTIVSIELKNSKEVSSSLLSFAISAYHSMIKQFNTYADFYSAKSAARIAQNVKNNPKTQEYLENGIRNYDQIYYKIDADPISILFYKFPAIDGTQTAYVMSIDKNYRFINFSSSNPVSNIFMHFNTDKVAYINNNGD